MPQVLLGFAAGAAIALFSFLAEHSRIAAGDYALYGNGAIIVTALLSPWAVYWGWTWALTHGGRALELALFVVGLNFGVGLWAVLDTVFAPQQPGTTLADAVPGFALSGSVFVIPASLLAALAYWLFATRLPLNSLTLFAAAFAAAVLVGAYWAGLGIIAGTCVAAATRAPARRVAIGAALLVLLVVIGNLPFFPGLLGT